MKASSRSSEDYEVEIVFNPSDQEYEWTVWDPEGDEVDNDSALSQDKAMYQANRAIEMDINENTPASVVYSTRKSSSRVIYEADVVEDPTQEFTAEPDRETRRQYKPRRFLPEFVTRFFR